MNRRPLVAVALGLSRRGFVLLGFLAWCAAAAAEPVDLELVLSVDSSGSIDEDEFKLQRLGYARALTDPQVLEAIRSGRHKSIAVTFTEWSGPQIHNRVVRWTQIATAADANKFAQALVAAPRKIFGGGTSLGGAIDFAAALFDQNDFEGRRRVIDISGDGYNNRGQWPDAARDRALIRRITINGLPIVDFDDGLEDYFRRTVIGGSGAFVIVANGFEDFARAIVRKLILEIYISRRAEAGGQS